LRRAAERAPDVDVTADDGVRHQLWVISDGNGIAVLTRAVGCLPALYIADGHHRSAAAARVAQTRGNGSASHSYFLAVMFPHSEMTILDYNRLLRDLNGQRPEELLAGLRQRFSIAISDQPVRPAAPGEFGMYVGGRWYRLTIRPDLVPNTDP